MQQILLFNDEHMETTKQKFDELKKLIASYGKAIVAYSGGADSTFLLKVCVDVLGRENVIAATGSSETYTPEELTLAKEIAHKLEVRHIVIETGELYDDAFSTNDPKRCYYCKKHFYKELITLTASEHIPHLLDGSNADDTGDYRPGRTAAVECGVESPLMQAGLTKDEIRLMSRELGLATWDKPANTCLASRIPYGNRITKEKLDMVYNAEDFIRGLGFTVVRVRHHGPIARIEIASAELNRFCSPEIRDTVNKQLKEIGFTYVAIDLEGYRMGSLNAGIPDM